MSQRPMNVSSAFRLIFWVILITLGISIYRGATYSDDALELDATRLDEQVNRGNIASITIYDDGRIEGVFYESVDSRNRFMSNKNPELIDELDEALKNSIKPPREKLFKPVTLSLMTQMLLSWGPVLLILIIFIFVFRKLSGGGAGSPSNIFRFGESKAKLATHNKKATFRDVAGVDEAKYELQEIVDFLKEPSKFQKLGGRIPKGVLLVGPPGTGKTLLARAVAGEAGVPFFSISGSDFVEMFVGVGASRVRDLFTQGQKNAPCIIFIDEIDAVGRQRGAGLGGGHDEREQTLNALLVEMDGFNSNNGIILMAATNRPDVLDPALLRPGRFDRRVVVDRPDVKGREGILAIYTRKIPVAVNVNINVIARGTPGFSGADLENLVNEAALNAARNDKKEVSMADFEHAKDKVLMGTERKSMIISDKEKQITAVHEAGHALMMISLEHADPLHKVTIIPRGMAMGLTMQLPEDDKHGYSKEYLEDMIATLLGGRIAEEIVNHSITTGASNDMERSTGLARKMVCEWGMSEKMGPLTFGKKEEQIFLGREINQRSDHSEATAVLIDAEIKNIVIRQYGRAQAILTEKRAILDKITRELLIREVLDAEQVRRIAAGESLEPL